MMNKHHIGILLFGSALCVCVAGVAGCSTSNENLLKEDSPSESILHSSDDQQKETERLKARIAVMDFEQKMTGNKHYQEAYGVTFQDMLATALVQTGRFTVLERGQLRAVLNEQDLGSSGRLSRETAPTSGSLDGAEYLVQGSVTAFDPGIDKSGSHLGSALSAIGFLVPGGALLGQVVDKVSRAHVAMEIRLVDAKTGHIVAATNVEDTSMGVAGLSGAFDGGGMGSMSAFIKTPMEKAIHLCVQRAAQFIAAHAPHAKKVHEAPSVVGLSMSGRDR